MSSMRRSAIVSPPSGATDAVNAVTSVTRCPCAMSVASVAPAENAASSRCGDTASTWSRPVPGTRGVGARRTPSALQTLVRSRTCGWIREWTNERRLPEHLVYPAARLPSTAVDLAPLTTLRLGGPARSVVEATTEAELVAAASDPAAVLLAGGSNVVVADAGFAGTVVRVLTRGRRGATTAATAAAARGRRRAVGRRSSRAASATGWRASSASRASPARPARRRSRTSAPTGRRSPRRSRRCACSTARPAPSPSCAPAECGFGYRDERVQAQAGPLGGARRRLARSSAGARARRSATPSSPARSASRSARARRSPRCARPCSRCAAARGWCSTPATTTRSAPARSSRTRSCVDAFAELAASGARRALRASPTGA